MSKPSSRPLLAAAVTAGLVVPFGAAPALAVAPEGTKVQLLNITDFHGRIADAGVTVGSIVESERASFDGATAFISAGDNIGASPYTSSAQQDAPTIEVLNALGLDASAVGNHEFDRGADDLTGRVSDLADFPHSGANVYAKGTTDVAPGIEEYSMVDADGVRIAVIGVVTEETASLVSPTGIEDIEFGDPTEAVNRVAGELEALPEAERPDMTVVSAHLGPESANDLQSAIASNAAFADIVENSDASVDALFFGHTHLEANFSAPIAGTDRTRPVIQSGQYGEAVGAVELESLGNGDWTATDAEIISTEDYPRFDSPAVDEVERIVAEAEAEAEVTGAVVAGEITEDITRATTESGDEDRGAESTLGNLVADALKAGVEDSQLEPADFGITNPGGLRDDLLMEDYFGDEASGEVTVAELNAVLPFANDHGVVTMTGADVIGLIEEQWQPEGASRAFLHLGVSQELEVVYDSEAPAGDRVVSVKVSGEDIDPNAEYRVATLSFLAAGGDNFASFANGTFEQSGLTDFEIWESYFEKNSPVSPDHDERQADAALDVLRSGSLDASVSYETSTDGGPLEVAADGSADARYEFESADGVDGPIVATLDVPAGLSVDFGELEAMGAQVTVDEASTAVDFTLESIPAGGQQLPFTVTADSSAEPGEYEITASLVADPEAQWWDDNPMPLGGSVVFDVLVTGADEDPKPGDDPTDEPTDDPTDEPTDDPSKPGDDPSEPGDPGKPGDDGDDDGRLPRTGSELAIAAAIGFGLLALGGAAIAVTRRRMTGM